MLIIVPDKSIRNEMKNIHMILTKVDLLHVVMINSIRREQSPPSHSHHLGPKRMSPLS